MKSFVIAATLGATALAAPHHHWEHDGSDWNKDDGWNHYKPTVTETKTVTASGKPSATPAMGPTDIQILNYALTLEHLEDKFYREGLANYTEADFAAQGFDAKFYNNLKIVASDEATHVSFLTSAIQMAGGTPVAECTYAFPATDPKSFVGLASVLEGVGVSAYLGAAQFIANKAYLTAAGSILTTEARHSSFVRNSLNQVPFAQPFDNPLDFNEVYTLAAPFIVDCPPSNPPLPVKAFPSLSLATTGTIHQNDTITLKTTKDLSYCEKVYAAFITVQGPVFGDCTFTPDGMTFTTDVPPGIGGESYVVLTKNMTDASDDNIVAGPAIVEVTIPEAYQPSMMESKDKEDPTLLGVLGDII